MERKKKERLGFYMLGIKTKNKYNLEFAHWKGSWGRQLVLLGLYVCFEERLFFLIMKKYMPKKSKVDLQGEFSYFQISNRYMFCVRECI